MHADDVFHYGHLTLMGTIEGLPATAWDTPGVCGIWSSKDVLAHLASYELVMGDVCASLLGEPDTPLMIQFRSPDGDFNDDQVARRAGMAATAVLEEYEAAHERAARLLNRIPVEVRGRAGALSWYGAVYDLEDFLIYTSYGHKREHSAQIAAGRDR